MRRFPSGGFTSFRARIFWSVIPLVLALLAFHGIMDLREHRRLVESEFMKRGAAIAGNLAHSSELGVFAEDRQQLEAAIRGVVGDPDVAYVLIYSDDRRLLGAGGKHVARLGAPEAELRPDDLERLATAPPL